MKTIILISLCLCVMVSAISAEKFHKHQGKLLKSGHEEHKNPSEVVTKPKDESELKLTKPKGESESKLTKPGNEQVAPKPAGAGRKHRNNHHGKNKKGGNSETAHTGRSRKSQTKPQKHNGQRNHNKNGRKHGRGKQAQ